MALFSPLKEIIRMYRLDPSDADDLEEIIAKAEIYAQLEVCMKLLNAIKHFDKNIPKVLLEAALSKKIEELELRLSSFEDSVFSTILEGSAGSEPGKEEVKTLVVEETR